MKNICVSTEALQKVKIQFTEWEKNFANHVSDNGPVPIIYKELLQLNNKKVNNSIFLFYFLIFWYKFIYFNWRLIILQYCIGFTIHQHESATGVHMFPILNPASHHPPHTIPLGHPSASAPSILYHASNLDWRFISHMILHMFQCHSPKSSHPRPLPQSPKDCSNTSVSLLLSCIQGYRYHLSKFHIYALVYCIGVFLSGLLHSV